MPITTVEASSLATLLEATRDVCTRFGKKEYWFRGHAVADWKLVPAVHRNFGRLAEISLTNRFVLGAPTRYQNCPGTGEWGDWICLMQHFGLPTRLLDWTRSLLTAAFFATSYEKKSGPGVVWILSPSALNKIHSDTEGVFLASGNAIREIMSPAILPDYPATNKVAAMMGREIDMRMAIQLGAFTIHGDPTPLEMTEMAEKLLGKILIPENAKERIEEELWVCGVRRSTLFPDLSNFAQELMMSPHIPRSEVNLKLAMQPSPLPQPD